MIPSGTPQPYLYILMRTDLTSLNPGKAMAQTAHAANDFAVTVRATSGFDDMFDLWRTDIDGNGGLMTFGTTIVLDGIDEQTINDTVRFMNYYQAAQFGDVRSHSGQIIDPSYPIKDGKVTHFLPLLTCGWIFCYKDNTRWQEVSKKWNLRLHK